MRRVASRWIDVGRSVVLAIISCLLVLLAGCGNGAEGSAGLSGHVLAVGSTALQPLVTKAASLFEAQNPRLTIVVQGGGSLYGLQAVTSGKSDIGDSDVYADPATYPDPNLTDHLVCVVPFTMIVNPDVPIAALSTAQIIAIYSTGTLRNWRQIGGPNLPIVPVVRPKTSGTRATFRKYVLGGRDEKGTLLQTDSSQTVLQTVARTPGAIGYLALSVLDSSVRAVAIDGVSATLSTITSGRYAFWGFEHMYTLGQSGVIEDFVDFMLTPAVQDAAQALGYIPIASMRVGVFAATDVARASPGAGLALGVTGRWRQDDE
jgi:phosphate transport system substrate-binding protein